MTVNSFVMYYHSDRLPLEFTTNLFGRESVSKSGQDGALKRSSEPVGHTFFGGNCALLSLLSIVELVNLLTLPGGQRRIFRKFHQIPDEPEISQNRT